jgi:hypothetical protein
MHIRLAPDIVPFVRATAEANGSTPPKTVNLILRRHYGVKKAGKTAKKGKK